MKANEAPEKIYIFENPILDFTKLSVRKSNEDIEYVRKDAFIEKAVDYINEHVEYYMKKDKMCNLPLCPLFEKQSFIEGFKKHMKGE